jgi:hypothetical protein
MTATVLKRCLFWSICAVAALMWSSFAFQVASERLFPIVSLSLHARTNIYVDIDRRWLRLKVQKFIGGPSRWDADLQSERNDEWMGVRRLVVAGRRVGTPRDIVFRSYIIALHPLWVGLCGAVCTLPAAIRIKRVRIARRRRAAGLCTHCGYDLRESPERCPECGSLQKSGE